MFYQRANNIMCCSGPVWVWSSADQGRNLGYVWDQIVVRLEGSIVGGFFLDRLATFTLEAFLSIILLLLITGFARA